MDKKKLLHLLSVLEDSLDDDSIGGYDWLFKALRKEIDKPDKTRAVYINEIPYFLSEPLIFPDNIDGDLTKKGLVTFTH